MNEFKKVVRQQEIITIDTETGEIKEQTTTTDVRVEKEPEYVKLYINDLVKLSGLPPSCNDLLHCLLSKLDYNGEITLVKASKDEIKKKLNMADSTFRAGMDNFIKRGILCKKATGLYAVNPFIFGRGEWKQIRNIRLTVEYNEKGRFLIKEGSDQKGIQKRIEVIDEKFSGFDGE